MKGYAYCLNFAVIILIYGCSQPNNVDSSENMSVVERVTESMMEEVTSKDCPVIVQGEIWYKSKIALPNSNVDVRLEDVSRADAASITIGKTSFVTDGKQVPIKFTLDADCGLLSNAVETAFRARITYAGKLSYSNYARFPYEKKGLNRVEVMPVRR